MASFRIPDDLVQLLANRRIIPFIGAGFSAVQDVPAWESLLKSLASEIQAAADIEPILSYEEIAAACGHDNLQIAEYLYLVAGESIGPIRHGLATALQSSSHLLQSTPHVELVNLGAPHVYTTNFDDLIERTYRELGLTVDVIAVPRDMARSHADRVEVVKYHGDLRHEQTLVLTESQYYTRLEFESPMDLKFRSDLLGRSVLFMGYSFRDINIRVIWFRLMQMMQDVPLKDRPPSYIVRLRANPVLDELYGAVGLKTLVIDPDQNAETPEERNVLLSDFLMDLSLRCAPDGKIPGSTRQAFVSAGLVQQAEEQLSNAVASNEPGRQRLIRTSSGRVIRRPRSMGEIVAPTPLLAALDSLRVREITSYLADRVRTLLLELARTVNTVASRVQLAAQLAGWFIPQQGSSPGVTLLVARSMLTEPSRDSLLSKHEIMWSKVWEAKLDLSDIKLLLKEIDAEVSGHESEQYTDDDVAYAVDLAKRISNGSLVAEDGDEVEAAQGQAVELVERAQVLYPAVEEYEPTNALPEPSAIRAQIEVRARELESEDEGEGEGS